jgi:hypothetical protein
MLFNLIKNELTTDVRSYVGSGCWPSRCLQAVFTARWTPFEIEAHPFWE